MRGESTPIEELLQFEVQDDHAVLVECDKSAKGDIVVPAEYEGVPVTEIGSGAFSGCSSIESIQLPDNLTSIGVESFMWCSSLKSIELPDTLSTLGACAFERCSSLESITLPDNLTTLGSSAFIECSSLKSITIPESVAAIEGGTFCNCTELDSITILNPDCKMEGSSSTICNSFGYEPNGFSLKVTYNGNISGYEGSTAQAYAEKFGYKFESLGEYAPSQKYDLGDVNNDGTVDGSDATLILKFYGEAGKDIEVSYGGMEIWMDKNFWNK